MFYKTVVILGRSPSFLAYLLTALALKAEMKGLQIVVRHENGATALEV